MSSIPESANCISMYRPWIPSEPSFMFRPFRLEYTEDDSPTTDRRMQNLESRMCDGGRLAVGHACNRGVWLLATLSEPALKRSLPRVRG